jgi:hypothetical protein
MDCRTTVRELAVAALLVVPACASAPDSDDARAERIAFRVDLPKRFTREASVNVEVTNEGSEPVFVWTLDGRQLMLRSEMKSANGFFPCGGNRPFCREGTELVRLDPGASIRGSVRIDELPPITGTTEPSALDWVGENDSVEGEYRLCAEVHTREHAATTHPPDCDERQLAGPPFVVPLTEWKR